MASFFTKSVMGDVLPSGNLAWPMMKTGSTKDLNCTFGATSELKYLWLFFHEIFWIFDIFLKMQGLPGGQEGVRRMEKEAGESTHTTVMPDLIQQVSCKRPQQLCLIFNFKPACCGLLCSKEIKLKSFN